MNNKTDPRLSSSIEEALALFDKKKSAKSIKLKKDTSLPALLSESITLCEQGAEIAPEPIRTLHHLSCTGGTLISKCIASMPNVLVLNEVDPLSKIPTLSGKSKFTPTDMISLLRQGDPQISSDLLVRLFGRDLEIILQDQTKIGRSLVLRDHTHSHFLTGPEVEERPTLLEMIPAGLPVRSIVTVRDPVDSFLSMRKQGWNKHFSPPGFEEYCRRYLVFLDRYQGVERIKYEAFTDDPKHTLRHICDVLLLDYSDSFLETFETFQFSGDSGRTGGTIASRPRREIDQQTLSEIEGAASYRVLASRLEYDVSL